MTKDLHLLIIEPESHWAERLRSLGTPGLDIDTVHDYFGARSLVRSDRYDVVILDLALGAGPSLCHQLRQDGVTAPIIVLGQPHLEHEIVLCLRAGASDFVGASDTLQRLAERALVLARRRSAPHRHTRSCMKGSRS